MFFRSALMALSLAAALSWTAVGRATTVAYWTFENGTTNTNVPHTGADGAFDGTTPDISGNGNNLSVWTQGSYAGFQYRSDVPYATVPQTGATDNLSIQNTGGYPAAFTDSSVSSPSGVNIETMMPTAFTVEASWKPENGGYRTVVGRDAQGVATSDGNLAALYLGAQPDNSFTFKFTDAAGNFWVASSAPGAVAGFNFPNSAAGTWYNLAGVSDGSTLKLYVNNALVASTPIVSSDARLAIGSISGGGWHAGGWTVGRGLYAGGHTDRGYGLIDEVRISDTALDPTQLLMAVAVPEPTSAALLIFGALGLPFAWRRWNR
jgi:hypothetical protein